MVPGIQNGHHEPMALFVYVYEEAKEGRQSLECRHRNRLTCAEGIPFTQSTVTCLKTQVATTPNTPGRHQAGEMVAPLLPTSKY